MAEEGMTGRDARTTPEELDLQVWGPREWAEEGSDGEGLSGARRRAYHAKGQELQVWEWGKLWQHRKGGGA
eukprot:361743-Chlamydomonas_euryale.AAC.2